MQPTRTMNRPLDSTHPSTLAPTNVCATRTACIRSAPGRLTNGTKGIAAMSGDLVRTEPRDSSVLARSSAT